MLRFLMISFLVIASSCGFHLRGSLPQDFKLAGVYIDENNAPLLMEQLKLQITLLKTPLAKNQQQASYIVLVKDEGFKKVLLSTDSNTAKAKEYIINYTAKIDIVNKDGLLIIGDDLITLSRDFTADETNILGKFSEESVLRANLTEEAAIQVLYHIQSLISNDRKKNK